ncbi:MAG: hypothetical protein QNJ23_03380 [Woeseiaceae bacterium]|nr:hypothetical protein [Woeseiaceae bacterium]
MPAISPLGWLHTVLGAIALISGVIALAKYKEITLETRSSQVYLFATLITAVSALGIYQHGAFGPGHGLALMTLLALGVGTFAAKNKLYGNTSRYVQAIAYSATLFFHSIPAVTDALLRLPVGDPVLDSIDDPVLKICYLAFFAVFLVGIGLQLRWIYRQTHQDSGAVVT